MNAEGRHENAKENAVNAAKAELKDLDIQLSSLQMVKGSMRLERKTFVGSFGGATRAEQELQSVRDEVISEGMQNGGIGEDAGERISKAQDAHEESVQFREDMKGLPTQQYEHSSNEHTWSQVPTEFMAKLESLGIDTENMEKYRLMQGHLGNGISDALFAREQEILARQKELQLEIPGGKERMVTKALMDSEAYSNESFAPFVAELKLSSDPMTRPGLGGAFGKIKEVIDRSPISLYPAEVQNEVIRQMTKQAFSQNEKLSHSELNADEVAAELQQMLENGRTERTQKEETEKEVERETYKKSIEEYRTEKARSLGTSENADLENV